MPETFTASPAPAAARHDDPFNPDAASENAADGLVLTGKLLDVEVNAQYTDPKTGAITDANIKLIFRSQKQTREVKYPYSQVARWSALVGQRVAVPVEVYAISDRDGKARLYYGAPKGGGK